jgi:hypothetical protein
MNAGAPPRWATSRSSVATSYQRRCGGDTRSWRPLISVDAAVTLDREGFAGELVDDVQQLEDPPAAV